MSLVRFDPSISTVKLSLTVSQNQLQENDWTTDSLTHSKRLLNCENRWIEMHQLQYESL